MSNPRVNPSSRIVAATLDALYHHIGSASSTGVIAVSGGADSVALLRILASRTTHRIIIAHLNHQLRGSESDSDAAFVATLCPELPRVIESADVAQLAAADNTNLEATARRLRYEFLTRVAMGSNASWIATGHTLDDQAETVLHRLIRGTAIRGLRGIAATRKLGSDILLVRPMLAVTREEVVGFLNEIGQSWREDSSNQDSGFTRNRLRHELLPLLRTFNPAIAQALGQVAEQADATFREIETETAAMLNAVELPRAGRTIVLDRGKLIAYSEQRLREMFVAVWEREAWPRDGMTHAHWQRVVDVALGRTPAWDLPNGVRIVAVNNVLRVGHTTHARPRV